MFFSIHHITSFAKVPLIQFVESLSPLISNLPKLKATTNCSNDINQLQKTAWQQYHSGQLDEALFTFQQLLYLHQSRNDEASDAEVAAGIALNHMSLISMQLGDLVKALNLCTLAIALAERTNNAELLGESLSLQGLIEQHKGKPQQALKTYQSALEVFVELADEPNIGRTLNNLGSIHNDLGQSDRAQQLCLTAAGILEAIRDQVGQATALYNAGKAYQKPGRYAQAQKYFVKAQAIRIAIGDFEGEAAIATALGEMCVLRGEPCAIDHYQDALELYQELGDSLNQALLTERIAELYQQQGRSLSAFEFYQTAVTLFQDMNDEVGSRRALNHLNQVYESLGSPEYALACPSVAIATALGNSLVAKRSRGYSYNRLKRLQGFTSLIL